MEKFIIEGGTPLAGTIVPAGNKNAALPALAASLLTREEVVLRNIPRIRDVEAMLELLRRLDVKVEWRDDNVVALQADELSHSDVDRDWAERIRASFLLAGPLLARRGRGGHAASGRRRDRAPAPRPAPRRLPRPRRGGARGPQLLLGCPPPTACTPATSSWTSHR